VVTRGQGNAPAAVDVAVQDQVEVAAVAIVLFHGHRAGDVPAAPGRRDQGGVMVTAEPKRNVANVARPGIAVPMPTRRGPAVVIDVQQQAAADPDYLVSVADIEAFEAEHGRIAAGSIVVMHSGWWRRWPDTRAYLGDDTPGDASNLHFPSFGPEAAELLVNQRQVAVLGVDTASIDYGQSREFRVHRIAAEHNVSGLENLTNLDRLPPTGARIIALPMKIEGGSGAPVRVISLLPD